MIDKSSVILGQEFIDKYLENLPAKLDDEFKKLVFHDDNKPL